MEIPKELCQQMEKLVQSTIEIYNLKGLSTPEEVGEKLGLSIQKAHLQQIDGLYHDEHKMIVINQNITLDTRRRFTFFHEICHYLLRNDEEFFSEINDLYDDDEEFRQAEERLCNVGATEFIAPREEVSVLIAERGFSIKLLFELEERYHISKQSAMWRLAECAHHPCILAICRSDYDIYPILKLIPKDIRVENAWSSECAQYKLRKETPIPKEHPIWNTVYSIDDHFSFDNSFIQFFTGNQMDANVEGVWINGRAYIVFNLQ